MGGGFGGFFFGEGFSFFTSAGVDEGDVFARDGGSGGWGHSIGAAVFVYAVAVEVYVVVIGNLCEVAVFVDQVFVQVGVEGAEVGVAFAGKVDAPEVVRGAAEVDHVFAPGIGTVGFGVATVGGCCPEIR